MGRLQTARLENFIRRWGSIKGPGSVLSETLGEVFPVLDLENLTPENQLTASWFAFAGFATTVAVAAQIGAVQLAVPAGSGVIAVLDKITINTGSNSNVTFGFAGPLQATAIATRNRDSRANSPINGMVQIRGGITSLAQFAGFLRTAAGIDRDFEIPNGLSVLGPGGTFTVVSSVVNDNIRVSFYGRSRVAEPSELSF